LVGNKTDLEEEVSVRDAKKLAKELELKYIETSAKNGLNVKEMFDLIFARTYKAKYQTKRDDVIIRNDTFALKKKNQGDKEKKKDCGC
jgi:Fe2+ transport system protein B